ncbi:MAG: hypothetical protein AAF555_09560 [Verrucomicrobiota bacterium]
MNIALVHYHFRRGGVTRVVENAAASLPDDIQLLALSGDPEHSAAGLPNVHIEGLGYRKRGEPGPSGEALAHSLLEAAEAHFGSAPDLWHIHNHSLGKNHVFVETLQTLASNGQQLLLQPHDFAEDGRPANYANIDQREHLYPIGPPIRYAFINGRDRHRLVAAGLPEDSAHLIGNPVAFNASLPETPPPGEAKLIVYPTRGIRRKNLGELLLLSALAPPGYHFVTTLGPDNSDWQPLHDEWIAFAREQQLPVTFAVANRLSPQDLGGPAASGTDFLTWLACAHRIVTTSIAEGFGLAYLEPALVGKALLGRDLPEITQDFTTNGYQLPQTYQKLWAPSLWVDENDLTQTLNQRLSSTYQAYGQKLTTQAYSQTLQSLYQGGHLDFGRLEEPHQRQLIVQARQHAADFLVETSTGREPLQDWLAQALTAKTDLHQNRQVVETHYSLKAYGQKLATLYRISPTKIASSALNPTQVLAQFLKPESYQPLLGTG